MTRYFFNLDYAGAEPDQVGTDLPDLAAARDQATRFVGEVLADEPSKLLGGSLRLDVTNAQMIVQFSLLVSLLR